MSTVVGAADPRAGTIRSPTEIDRGLFGAVRAVVHAHTLATDALLAGALLGASTIWLVLSPFAGVGTALVQSALIVPLIWRRSYPAVVFLVVSAVALIQWWLGYRLIGDAALLIALYTVAVHESRHRALVGAGILELGAAMAASRWTPAGPVARSFLFLSATVVAALFGGFTVRSGSHYMAWLAERAERLEIERDQQKAIGAAVERTRIAREVHDIVAHSLSVMITLADAASVVNDSDQDRATQAMRQTSEVGRQALSDMRTVINVLRTDDQGAELGPQPTIGQLDDLFERVRATGLEVDVETEGRPVALGAATELTVYRIIQEALTNTIKHAAATRVRVVVLYGDDIVELTVTDNGQGATARPHGGGAHGGRGIEGMAERAGLHGGRVQAGPGPGGGWSVSATLRAETRVARA